MTISNNEKTFIILLVRDVLTKFVQNNSGLQHWNTRYVKQLKTIRTELKELLDIIDNKDAKQMKQYLTKIRSNVKRDVDALK